MARTELEKRLQELDATKARGTISDEEYAERRAAILADTSAPARKRGGLLRWGALGCLGIFGALGLLVIGLIVIIVVAVGTTADDTPDSGGDVHVALAEGASGVIAPEGNGSKRSRVTILRFVDDAQSANEFSRPAEGAKWVLFEVEVENVGTAQVTSLDWKLRASNDVETDRTYVTGLGEDLQSYHDLSPGGKVRGIVVFAIPASTSVKWVRADPNPFLADDLYFDAE